ncbi:MAG: hypothetical protein U0165_14945 [Polyangiaceae bacterium]
MFVESAAKAATTLKRNIDELQGVLDASSCSVRLNDRHTRSQSEGLTISCW